MIKKLLNSEYLKGCEMMTDPEREAWRKRVGEWLRTDGERLLQLTDRPMAKAQNLVMMSVKWGKEDCEAAHEGVVLLTALMNVCETWLPSQIWSKSAWRAIRQIVSVLSEMKKEELRMKNGAGAQGNDNPAGKPQGTVETRGGDTTAGQGTKDTPAGKQQGTVAAGMPVRPKHIDQYLHLLPKGTQEKGAMVRGLLRELDEVREKMRLLMGDEHASADARAAWARKAVQIDERLKGIYKELDREWEKLVQTGRVVVDAVGNVSVRPDADATGTVGDVADQGEASKKRVRKPLTEEEKMAKAQARAEKLRQEAVRKAGLLRKWLIDLRNAKTDEQKVKWVAKFREMVAIGGEKAVTDKVREAAVFYEIDLDKLDDKQG